MHLSDGSVPASAFVCVNLLLFLMALTYCRITYFRKDVICSGPVQNFSLSESAFISPINFLLVFVNWVLKAMRCRSAVIQVSVRANVSGRSVWSALVFSNFRCPKLTTKFQTHTIFQIMILRQMRRSKWWYQRLQPATIEKAMSWL